MVAPDVGGSVASARRFMTARPCCVIMVPFAAAGLTGIKAPRSDACLRCADPIGPKEQAMNSSLTAGDVCNRQVAIAHKGMPLNEAARLMRQRHVGSLVAVEDSGAGNIVVGMLTDRDIVTAVVAKDMDAATLRVDDVMTRNVVTARESDSVLDVLTCMRGKAVRRIPVTGPNGELIGLIAADDVLGLIAEELRTLVQALVAQPRVEQQARP
jgi:CBS domain-containing protein